MDCITQMEEGVSRFPMPLTLRLTGSLSHRDVFRDLSFCNNAPGRFADILQFPMSRRRGEAFILLSRILLLGSLRNG